MNSSTLNVEHDEINQQSIKNSPKFGEKTLAHLNSIISTDKNISKESLGSLRDNLKRISSHIYNKEGEDSIQKVYCVNSVVLLDSEINQAKKLKLEDVEGNLLNNQKLLIDGGGLQNGLRKMRDGFTFFGTLAEQKNFVINDFIIKCLKENDPKVQRLFVIYFDRSSQKYYLRNINDNSNENNIFIYIKITKPLKIQTKQYISMLQVVFSATPIQSKTGECHLSVVIIKNTSKEKEEKSEYNNNNDRLNYIFQPRDSPITIGRGNCKILIRNSFLSKKHSTIFFNKYDSCWEISDGFEERKSTNGTWLMVNSKYEIDDETFVKIANNTFRINFA